jgi:undecaprenyl diphosphate synthase
LNDRTPQHIAIVMDGNGRWAANQGLLRVEGHRAGVNSVKTTIQCCLKNNVSVLSLFAFSSENWARPETEVECLMDLFLQALEKEVSELSQQGVSLRFTGSREGLSVLLQDRMTEAEQLTAANNRLVLNVVINYGGRWDIIQAAKNISASVLSGDLSLEAISESLFSEHLNTHGLPDPDLFIRTSGERRISNFFLWQLAYTELYFSEVSWPDFNDEEFEKALTSFRQRERRFGKTSSQLNEINHV